MKQRTNFLPCLLLSAGLLTAGITNAPAHAQAVTASASTISSQISTAEAQYKQTMSDLNGVRAKDEANNKLRDSQRTQMAQIDTDLKTSRAQPRTPAAKQKEAQLMAQRATLSKQMSQSWSDHKTLSAQNSALWAHHMAQIGQVKALYAQKAALKK